LNKEEPVRENPPFLKSEASDGHDQEGGPSITKRAREEKEDILTPSKNADRIEVVSLLFLLERITRIIYNKDNQ
jgi:hypothetical protein